MEVQREPLQPFHMVNQVRLSLDKRMQDKGILLRNELSPTRSINADVALFREVLFNLLSNAVKFCRSGDTVTVREGKDGTIEINDTGTGIDDRLLPHLFEKEKKTSTLGTEGEPGTGLGLPLCKDIMVAHGGDITVISEPQKGSSFFLHFPIEQ